MLPVLRLLNTTQGDDRSVEIWRSAKKQGGASNSVKGVSEMGPMMAKMILLS
jgi:hypothetical protein